EGEHMICSTCISDLPYTNFELDPCNHATSIKFYGKIPETEIYCLLKYKKGNIAQRLLYEYKYNGQVCLGKFFAQAQIYRFQKTGIQPFWDLIVPVPLHSSKQKIRGYNQSEVYGLHLSESLSIPLTNLSLMRKESNQVQALMSRNNRFENVKSIYSLGDKESIYGKSILLVDDVITTGATLEVCTNLLLENGAKKVSLASIATSIFS
ncbi:MAG: ComF family protein, partial [Cytophagales bacterium]|nr:ComF family protein [Cytophagales bacterium]